VDTIIPWPAQRNRGFTGPYVKPKTTTSHQDDIPASGSRHTAPPTTKETAKSALTNVSSSQVARTTHEFQPRTVETHDRDRLTDTSPSQSDKKKCIQVGRDTYAVMSQPGTSYSSHDYDSILVIDSSSSSAPVPHTTVTVKNKKRSGTKNLKHKIQKTYKKGRTDNDHQHRRHQTDNR